MYKTNAKYLLILMLHCVTYSSKLLWIIYAQGIFIPNTSVPISRINMLPEAINPHKINRPGKDQQTDNLLPTVRLKGVLYGPIGLLLCLQIEYPKSIVQDLDLSVIIVHYFTVYDSKAETIKI